MEQFFEKNPFVLMEASIVELLRRSGKVHLHETLVNAPLIYDQTARKVIGDLYKGYIDIALNADLPILVCTPTWRTNKTRVKEANVPSSINIDAVHYLKEIRDSYSYKDTTIKIGGMIGCKNDCYLPEEGLSIKESQYFHSWQIEQLAEGGADFLIAETLPNVQEALGIAKAMELMDIPYFISFVISRDGCVLDGTTLEKAINLIDSNTKKPPLGYMVNCAYPSFLCPQNQPSHTLARLVGYLANASSLDHCDLEKADELKTDSISHWGDLMLELNHTYGVKVLGGCCGTGVKHLQYLIDNRSTE